MARSGKTGRKPKANKNNVKTEQNKPNKSSIPTISANQHVKKSA